MPKYVLSFRPSDSGDEFNKAATIYNRALQESGFSERLYMCYEPTKREKERRKNRPRKVLWFNPPFSRNVKTNIGKHFLHLLRKYFHKGHILNKIFNKNTCKVSYSCMENMQSIIGRHNAKVLKPNTVQSTRESNCRKIDHCPLVGKCLTSNIVYQAFLSTEGMKWRQNVHTYVLKIAGNLKTLFKIT